MITLNGQALVDLADDFFRALRRQGRSPNTIRNYGWGIEDLRDFLERSQDPAIADMSRLTRDQLEKWQDDQLRHLKARSRALAVTAVRGLLKWAALNDRQVDANLWLRLEAVQAPRGIPRPIPDADYRRIVAFLAPVRPHMALKDLRDRALFFYLIGTGARVSEALQVNREDIAGDVVVWQKGGGQKLLFAPPRAMAAVLLYVERRRDNHPALWVALDDPVRRLTQDAVREIWRVLARRVGVPRWTTHQLRHTAATLMIDGEVDEIVAANHLGHRGLATIQGYAEIRKARRQKAIDVLDEALQGPGPEAVRGLLPRLSKRPRRRVVPGER